jgi:hypothetical protein
METFTEPKNFVVDPDFNDRKLRTLRSLDLSDIDLPVVDIVTRFNKLDFCFTLQICYGHFVYQDQPEIHNLDPLPSDPSIGEIDYRIAYLALCLADNQAGRALFDALTNIPSLDPGYIQFGSADWFWERHLNSYALQVEPARLMYKDHGIVDYQEALHLEKVRGIFFAELRRLLQGLLDGNAGS